jgi:threonylcarbamoyladenosine tRNA methylthiotransferase MtaB
MFARTMQLVEECGLTWLHVFPYSAREGTPAARMPQTDGRIARVRAGRLRSLGDDRAARHRRRMRGAQVQILVERPGLGRTEDFSPVRLNGSYAPGDIVAARIIGEADRCLIAEPT